MIEQKYRPYLLHRVTTQLAPSNKRLQALLSYDYMGAAEFEFGAVPASMARIRMIIIEHKAKNPQGDIGMVMITLDLPPAKFGPYAGKPISVLAPQAKMEDPEWRESFIESVKLLTEDKIRLKEPCYMCDAFTAPRFGRHHPFDVWHDIKNDVFFAFNTAILALIASTLTRHYDMEYAKDVRHHFKGGESIAFVKAKPGAINTNSDKSVENWKIAQGRISSFDENGVTILSQGDRFRVDWNLIITCPDSAQGCDDIEVLRKVARRG
jgi:hypothetical protein